jgi:nucleoredoxin
MKHLLAILVAALCHAGSALAEFENWTSSDGRIASMKLVEVVRNGDTIQGKFQLPNGQTVTLAADALAATDAARLAKWKPPVAAKPSIFDELLDGNLVVLDGSKFTKRDLEKKPTKYYIFYYTASWCGPCQQYTPGLVKFYNENRPKYDTFEIVLVTSDSDKGDMLAYAKDKKMPWPHVDFSKVEKVEEKLGHDVRGIPTIVVCGLDGKVVSRTESFAELTKLVSE